MAVVWLPGMNGRWYKGKKKTSEMQVQWGRIEEEDQDNVE